MHAYLQLNGMNAGICVSTHHASEGWFTFALESTLKLQKGDRITLLLSRGEIWDNMNHATHFNGWMLEEDLIM